MRSFSLAAVLPAICLLACSGGTISEDPAPAAEVGPEKAKPKITTPPAETGTEVGQGLLPAQIVDVTQVGMDGTVRISLLVETEDERLAERPYLYIFVGQTEGQALFRAMHGFETPRPMTHNLLASMVRTLEGTLKRVVVAGMTDGVYIGRIDIQTADGRELQIDCRPSDALPLAVLSSAPVMVHEEIVREAGLSSPPDEYEEPPHFEPEPPRLWDSV